MPEAANESEPIVVVPTSSAMFVVADKRIAP
jgi:hypothetical protein